MANARRRVLYDAAVGVTGIPCAYAAHHRERKLTVVQLTQSIRAETYRFCDGFRMPARTNVAARTRAGVRSAMGRNRWRDREPGSRGSVTG